MADFLRQMQHSMRSVAITQPSHRLPRRYLSYNEKVRALNGSHYAHVLLKLITKYIHTTVSFKIASFCEGGVKNIIILFCNFMKGRLRCSFAFSVNRKICKKFLIYLIDELPDMYHQIGIYSKYFT